MKRLSRPITQLAGHYDAVVIGSGYGGSIAASRLSRLGKRVCLLERGREILPGEYPASALSMLGQLQVDTPLGHIGRRHAMFDLRVHRDLSVIVGCGLGGTSLINAALAIRPEPEVFADPAWPAALCDPAILNPYFARAEAMLDARPYPSGRPQPAKLHALEKAATQQGKACARLPLTVNFQTFDDGRNAQGVPQAPCTACGDCVSGCNVGAKNTLLMNYLPDAAAHGAEIFTACQVSHLSRDERGWQVHGTSGSQGFIVHADVVVLGAGSLGSTEILLRSREQGLSLSPRLGEGFSANGDTFGFACNTREPIRGVGTADRFQPAGEAPGPCSTAVIDLRENAPLPRSLVVIDGVVPRAMRLILPLFFLIASSLTGSAPPAAARDSRWQRLRRWLRAFVFARNSVLDHSLFTLIVGHDDSKGQLSLGRKRLQLRWPGVGQQAQFRQGADAARQVAHALGGQFVPNPVWNPLSHHHVLTGHPLGGCALAEDGERGVVDTRCRVFSGEGSEVHEGLYVMDGAILPRSLGINPLLTICALAERACDLLAEERGWTAR